MPNKTQLEIYRRQLVHWMGKDLSQIQNKCDRIAKFKEYLLYALDHGLRLTVKNNESLVVRGRRRATLRAVFPTVCFSDNLLSESEAHAGLYGGLGLGFSRKFVIGNGGQPLSYTCNATEGAASCASALNQVYRELFRTEAPAAEWSSAQASFMYSLHYLRDIRATPNKWAKRAPRRGPPHIDDPQFRQRAQGTGAGPTSGGGPRPIEDEWLNRMYATHRDTYQYIPVQAEYEWRIVRPPPPVSGWNNRNWRSWAGQQHQGLIPAACDLPFQVGVDLVSIIFPDEATRDFVLLDREVRRRLFDDCLVPPTISVLQDLIHF